MVVYFLMFFSFIVTVLPIDYKNKIINYGVSKFYLRNFSLLHFCGVSSATHPGLSDFDSKTAHN